MKSRFSTLPNVPVKRTPDGRHRVTCDQCEFDETRSWRATADVIALEHARTHTTIHWKDGGDR